MILLEELRYVSLVLFYVFLIYYDYQIIFYHDQIVHSSITIELITIVLSSSVTSPISFKNIDFNCKINRTLVSHL